MKRLAVLVAAALLLGCSQGTPVPARVQSVTPAPTAPAPAPTPTACHAVLTVTDTLVRVNLRGDCPQGGVLTLTNSWNSGAVEVRVNGTEGNGGGFGLPSVPGEYGVTARGLVNQNWSIYVR